MFKALVCGVLMGCAIRSAAMDSGKYLKTQRPFFAKATKGILRCAKNGGRERTWTSDLYDVNVAL